MRSLALLLWLGLCRALGIYNTSKPLQDTVEYYVNTITQDRSRRPSQSHALLIDTSLGRVLGRQDRSSPNVLAFLGIPYAEPPIGKLRFRPPKPKRPWYPSIYKAFELSPECLQSELFSSNDLSRLRSEDCLYLNIWKPKRSSKSNPESKGNHNHNNRRELLPVLVWIYGGAFIHGGSAKPEYMGNKLAEKGVVVVSFNYRIGALGFLVSTSDGLYGNYGLDDQKTAIQWVQDNIQAFGGDPHRITLFGESAGAMSIVLHLLDQQQLQERQYQAYQQQVAHYRSRRARYTSIHEGFEEADLDFREFKPRKLFHAVIMQSNPLGYK